MKYFHSLIITGFLISFFPLSAETVLAEASGGEFVEHREEASLSSLDEELSLLDEEFEEFKEELYSLENDLQKKEKHSLPIADTLPEMEKSSEKIVAFEEKSHLQMDSHAFEFLSPEIDTPSIDSELSLLEKSEAEFPFDLEISEPEVVSDEETNAELVTEPSDGFAFFEQPAQSKESQADSFQETFSREKLDRDSPAIFNGQGSSLIKEQMPLNEDTVVVDLKQAFSGAPIIYSLLFTMSVVAVGIWLYSILLLRSSARISQRLIKDLQNKLNSNSFEEALSLCKERDTLLCKMIASGIYSRRHGLPVMLEAMKVEGKRASITFWQKIGLLNDIAIIAPMLGLLGTVLGMFYAFYDINRSIESISTLFDGLGVSVGTTVAGLIVAILSLILHSAAKYRLVRALALVENEAQSVATLIDDRTSIYKGV